MPKRETRKMETRVIEEKSPTKFRPWSYWNKSFKLEYRRRKIRQFRGRRGSRK